MSLPAPNDKDQAKLHAEVNQYINQRFIIATTAITVSGVVLGWIVAGTSVGTGTTQVRESVFFLALLLLLILAVLFVVAQIINASAWVITSYLRVTKVSVWEDMYDRFGKAQRKGGRVRWIGQREWMTLLFGALGVLATFTPLGLAGLLGVQQGTKLWVLAAALGVFFFAYECMIFFTAKRQFLDLGADADRRWDEVAAENRLQKIDRKYFCAYETVSAADYPLEEFLSKWRAVRQQMRHELDAWLSDNVLTARADDFDIWYRGVYSDSEPYCLTPGSQREKDLTVEGERVMFLDFERQSKQSGAFESFWSIYSRMQHHRMPTRLLDWSEGHLIALYFATCGDEAWNSKDELNPAVFFIFPQFLNYLSEHHEKYGRQKESQDVDQEEKVNAFRFTCDSVLGKSSRSGPEEHPLYPYQLLWGDTEKGEYPELPRAMWPAYRDTRIRVQKSVFTIHGQLEGIQKSTEPYGRNSAARVLPLLGKIEIQKEVVPELRRQLADAGIAQSTLYPELDGVANELKWEFSCAGRKRMLRWPTIG
jgi:hypothetical protein